MSYLSVQKTVRKSGGVSNIWGGDVAVHRMGNPLRWSLDTGGADGGRRILEI